MAPTGTAFNPGPFSVFVVGGGMVPLGGSGSGNVTGVDTFFGPGAFLIDNKQGGASNAVAMLGARIRTTWQDQDNWNYVLGKHQLKAGGPISYGKRISWFVETGVQSGFGAQSFLQPFGGVSTTPQGFGSNTVKENFQIPVLIGVGLPLSGPGEMPVFLDIYGGVTVDNWTQTLQGREAGAPGGGGGFFSQSNRTTLDPTIGSGLRVAVGDFNGDGVPDIIVGVGAELSFRPGGVVQAQSPNFPSESYYGTIDARPNLNIMFRVGIPFGGR